MAKILKNMVTYPLSKIVSYTKTHMRDERGGYKLNIHYVLWERAANIWPGRNSSRKTKSNTAIRALPSSRR